MQFLCRVCGLVVGSQDALANHIRGCVERNAEIVDAYRPPKFEFGDCGSS